MEPLPGPEISNYVSSFLPALDPLFDEIERYTLHESSAPQMFSGRYQAHLLAMLARMARAEHGLEIGCFTGYTSLYLAAYGGLREMTTLEIDAANAQRAGGYFARHPAGSRVRLIEGDALTSLKRLTDAGERFDFVYIDADKERYVAYLNAVQPLLSAHGVIVADNVLRHGDVLDAANYTAGVEAMRTYAAQTSSQPGWISVMLPLRDGLMLTTRAPEVPAGFGA